ncbi:HAMP domain-containing methyl-accepting chemotaxis protein [Bdellovibrio svalbardensis]|uniref:Methyl-accepting chemotaxis protein n=1 Tax=Bdellovibrio svalbardensis TaxID=2972972 RepID=A0ABT6DMN6_9BACT|nr:methyl-accepting chemotaxis protein [Bdellovibrio svalbardensis]MDG0817081.1 methyl-accepting chemotaxis protein [Bdellovibrio svalbardensis]
MSKWFRGLRFKFLAPVFFQVAIILMVGGTSFVFMGKLSAEIEEASLKRLPEANSLATMNSKVHEVVRYLWGIYGSGIDVEQRKKLTDEVSQAIADFEAAKVEYEKFDRSADGKDLYKPVNEQWAAFKAEVDSALKYLSKNDPRWDEMAKYNLSAKVRDSAAPLVASFKKISSHTLEEQKKRGQESVSQAHLSKQTIILVSGVMFLLSLVVTFMLATNLTKRITQFISQIRTSSETVNSASGSLSSASQILSSSSVEAAASLEETVASLNMIMDLVKGNDQKLKLVTDLSRQAGEAAHHGENEVRTLGDAMAQISDSSKRISEITDVIDDIAFQTNLLALNASVEAARAGEHGRGFAVVAEAVRTLAQRSAIAAKDISSLIKETSERVERGASIAGKSSSALKNIVEVVEKVTVLNSEISAASQEQSEGINQINHAMTQLDESTQKNAQMAQEVANSSEKMRHETDGIHADIFEFNKVVEGSKQNVEDEGLKAA